jgi:hypothetical protein
LNYNKVAEGETLLEEKCKVFYDFAITWKIEECWNPKYCILSVFKKNEFIIKRLHHGP